MNMLDHIRRSMKGEPSPPKLNEVKVLGEKPVFRKASVSSVDARIKALIESKKINEITEAPLGRETSGAPVPSTDNFSVKAKGKPKVMNANGVGPPEVDGQEQVELGGVTPVDLEPETKDVTPKDLRKEGIVSAVKNFLSDTKSGGSKEKPKGKTVVGGLKAGGKFLAKTAGTAVANELGKQVGISGSTITGAAKAFASGGKQVITARKNAFKAGTSTTKMSKSEKPSDSNDKPPNPMSAGKAKSAAGKSKKPATVKGATAGSGEPEKMTPDQFRKEAGLPPRSKAKPGTAPESSTSKGATLMSKDSLFKQGSSSSDNAKPAHQAATNHNKPMVSQSNSGSGSNRLTKKLNSRLMSSTASSTSSNPMSAKTSNPMSAKSSGVSSLDKFKHANRMKIRKINEELLELVQLIEWQNRYKQPPAMNDRSAEEHLDSMISQHNKGLEAKAAGDKTKARVHFNTRDHHFAWFVRKAPEEHSNKMDLAKVRAMLDIKEDDYSPLEKVMEIRRRLVNGR